MYELTEQQKQFIEQSKIALNNEVSQIVDQVNAQLAHFKIEQRHIVDSRECKKHLIRTLKSVISNEKSAVQDMFIYLAQTNKNSLSLLQLAHLMNHQTTGQASQINLMLRALEIVTYDKQAQIMTVNFEHELSMALYENARFILEDMTDKEKKQLIRTYKYNKLI